MQNAHMRVHRVHREKVLKIDRPFRAGGFLSLTGPLAPRVADCRSAVHSEHILKER